MNRTQRLNQEIAYEIRRRREALNLSQEELAELCGIHRTYVGAIERAERNITVATLLKFADALDCDIHNLIPKKTRQ